MAGPHATLMRHLGCIHRSGFLPVRRYIILLFEQWATFLFAHLLWNISLWSNTPGEPWDCNISVDCESSNSRRIEQTFAFAHQFEDQHSGCPGDISSSVARLREFNVLENGRHSQSPTTVGWLHSAVLWATHKHITLSLRSSFQKF